MSLTVEESYRNSYHYFVEAVETLASEPASACERMGDYNVAWEVKDDVQAGKYLAEWELLGVEAKAKIDELVRALDKIPQGLLLAASGRASNLTAMSAEAWLPIRHQATALIVFLESFTKANEAWLRGEASPAVK
jgi:hypothetical protein